MHSVRMLSCAGCCLLCAWHGMPKVCPRMCRARQGQTISSAAISQIARTAVGPSSSRKSASKAAAVQPRLTDAAPAPQEAGVAAGGRVSKPSGATRQSNGQGRAVQQEQSPWASGARQRQGEHAASEGPQSRTVSESFTKPRKAVASKGRMMLRGTGAQPETSKKTRMSSEDVIATIKRVQVRRSQHGSVQCFRAALCSFCEQGGTCLYAPPPAPSMHNLQSNVSAGHRGLQ